MNLISLAKKHFKGKTYYTELTTIINRYGVFIFHNIICSDIRMQKHNILVKHPFRNAVRARLALDSTDVQQSASFPAQAPTQSAVASECE